jgi:hypothetical protein
VGTGGATAFTFVNAPSAGQSVNSGTTFNLNYTPGWSGSVSQGGASGSVSSSLVYNIGALNGSASLLNAGASWPASPTMDLGASLNSHGGAAVNTSASASGPGTTAGYTLSAGGCAIVCVTLASATLEVTIGTQVQQSATVTPTVTYGDLVWISTSPLSKYSAGDPQAFIAGSGGSIANTLGSLGSLGLTKGQTFFYNMLPEVELSVALSSQAQLSLPASLTASYDVLRVGGSQSVPLGNLYTLSTGAQQTVYGTTFAAGYYDSIKMSYIGTPHSVYYAPEAVLDGNYSAQKLSGDPLPTGSGPCATTPVGCDLALPGGSGNLSGYGTQPGESSLIPNDQVPGGICVPAGSVNAGTCINKVVLTGGPLAAPELSAGTASSAATLLIGSLLVVRGGRTRKRIA